jgi:hypothetical protein
MPVPYRADVAELLRESEAGLWIVSRSGAIDKATRAVLERTRPLPCPRRTGLTATTMTEPVGFRPGLLSRPDNRVGARVDLAPPTPPSMRVRTRRFAKHAEHGRRTP